MRLLGIHLLGAMLTIGSPTLPAQAQFLPSASPHVAPDLQNDERDMLARARAELERNRNGATDDAADSIDAFGDAVRDQALQTEVDRRIREAEREAELDQLTAAIRRRNPAVVEVGPIPPQADESANASAPESTHSSSVANSPLTRATVLLEMDPGHTGIRALNPTADPILCMPDVCWISRGPDRDARMVPRRKALGPLNTLGDRAGACNDRLGCVFRNIEVTGASAVIQPVDLRILKHDRRAPLEARIDATCRIEHRTLSCTKPQSGGDYRLLLVPEPIAQEAGGSLLLTAIGQRTTAAQRSSAH